VLLSAFLGLATNGFTSQLLSSRNARFRSKKAHASEFFRGLQIRKGQNMGLAPPFHFGI
jgi:hypothetical protein